MVHCFITEPGGTNYLTVENNGHSFEAFLQNDFSLENTVSDMEGERMYETSVDMKVIIPLIGDGVNQESPKYAKRENAVEVKIMRERTILNPDFNPERLS
jgi:hypothetical protein